MSDERFKNNSTYDGYGKENIGESANTGQGDGSGSMNYRGSEYGPEGSDFGGGARYSDTGYPGSGNGHYSDARYSDARYPGSGNGRYYSYGNGKRDAGPSAPSGRKSAKKNSSRLGVALAVILVFILGAGAGAYVSGRGGSVSSASAAAVESQGGNGAETEKNAAEKETTEKDTGEGKEQAKEESSADTDRDVRTEEGTVGISQEKRTISRVEDAGVTEDPDQVVADVAAKVMPAIVSVYNKYTQEGQFFGRTYTQEAESTGSGIIIEETEDELLIVTNNHVVEGADSLSVQFINEENCEAALKGTDAGSDLAVISVSLSDLSADTKSKIAIAELGNSDDLKIGEQAIAIGNALGYGQSLTVGYVSALNREITSENGITGTFIQTDAAINPGNSGGALLNSQGQVIGINSNKIGGSSVEGMGFAIPISKAIPIISELKLQESRTKVAEEEQGVIGIRGISVTSSVASAYGLPEGAYVEEIIEGSGAAASDLEAGDIITAINGQKVASMEDLSNQLSYYTAGTEVTLTVQHPAEGSTYEEREVKVTLSKRSALESSSGQEPRGRQGQQQDPYSGSEEGNDYFFNPFGF